MFWALLYRLQRQDRLPAEIVTDNMITLDLVECKAKPSRNEKIVQLTRDLLAWVRATRKVVIRHTYSHQQEPWNSLADVCADYAAEHNMTTAFPLRDLRFSMRDLPWKWLQASDEAARSAYPENCDDAMVAGHCKSKATPSDVDLNWGEVVQDDYKPRTLKFVTINFGTLKKSADPRRKERLILEQAKQEGIFCIAGQEARSSQVQYQRHGWLCLFGPTFMDN